MPRDEDSQASGRGGPERFNTTHWSVVLAAGNGDTKEAQSALAVLCQSYWYPLYAFARRCGSSTADAKDLTQGYFAKLLEKGYLRDVDPERGRFRSFLLASFKHFMANERDWNQAQKRGGRVVIVPFEADDAENRYRLEPAHETTPERIFERRWALMVLERTLERLHDAYVSGGKELLFDELKGCLTGSDGMDTYTRIGARLGLSEGAVKVAAHRLRERYRKLLRCEIANTVATPDQVEDELRHLQRILTR